MAVKEWGDRVVFMHRVESGASDRSYGIHVAKLAGLPGAVVSRAEQVLEILEQGEQAGSLARLADDLPLFAVQQSRPALAPEAPSALEARLEEVNRAAQGREGKVY